MLGFLRPMLHLLLILDNLDLMKRRKRIKLDIVCKDGDEGKMALAIQTANAKLKESGLPMISIKSLTLK